MTLTASKLRQDVYNILDRILETGEPVEIERKGKKLRIVPAEPRSKLDNLVRRDDYMRDDPDSYVHIDWSKEWKPDFP